MTVGPDGRAMMREIVFPGLFGCDLEGVNMKFTRRDIRNYLIVALITAAVVAPTTAFAGGTASFSDVDGSNIFQDDISWLSQTGVTAGCGGDKFCPKDTVTREQMAAFMHRLAVNEVVNASTAKVAEIAVVANSATSADFATTATNSETADSAADAAQLAGRSANSFQPSIVSMGLSSPISFDVPGNGTHVVATATTPSLSLCPVGSATSTTYLITATGYTNNMNPGETAKFVLRMDGTTTANTQQILYDDNGTISIQWLHGVSGTAGTFELLSIEEEGDAFIVQNANIIVQAVELFCLK